MDDERIRGEELPDELADRAGLQLLAAARGSRAAVLAALIREHPLHAAALRRLLADLDRVDGVLENAFPALGVDFVAEAPGSPESVGGHRVIRRLGEGAFGVVYLCAQEKPVMRQVAIKVVRSGAGGPETLRRFAAERQLLAALNHPTITQVFDAGELPDGRPFFVMEFVDGAPIRAYCEARRLAVHERLRLFGEVCRGVAHAHARGIVHRDLKPANVLVVDTEAGAMPKIIDFGIAKALDPTRDGEPRTEIGRVVGTPGYMSPEQASGRVDEVDGRADVFALGVMLYELLTGELPWAKGAAADTAEPVRPSSRVTTASEPGTESAVARRQRASELRGDLDRITLKALARERVERYPNVATFAADLERHLRGEAVSVGPPSLSYRLRKFVRRNRTSVAVASSAVLVLAVVGTLFHARAVDAETAAERAMAQATQAVELLVARAGDERLRHAPEQDAVRQVLAQDAIGFYDQWLRDRPRERRLRLGRCQALVSLSSVHFLLGRMPDAEHRAAEAVAEAEELFAETPDDLSVRGMLAEALRRRGRALGSLRRVPEAAALLARAIEHFEAYNRAASDHPAPLSGAYVELAAAREFLRDTAGSLEALGRAIAVLEQSIREGSATMDARTDLTLARVSLARNLLAAGRPGDAAAAAAAAEAGLAAVTLDLPRATARVHSTWALIARRRGDWAMAIEHSLLAVAAGERWRDQDRARIVSTESLLEDLGELAEAYEQNGDARGADGTAQRALTLAEATVADFPGDVSHLARLESLASWSAWRIYQRQRLPELERAQAWMQRAVDAQRAVAERGGKAAGPQLRSLVILAMVVEARGQASAATWDAVAAALPVDAELRAPGHDFDLAGWCGVGRSRLRGGRFDEAAAALAQADRAAATAPAPPAQACDLERLRADLALRRGDVDGAIEAAERMVDVLPEQQGWWRAAECHFASWRHLVVAVPRDEAAAAVQRDAAAELYRRVIDGLDEEVRGEPDDPSSVVPWGVAGVRLAQIEMALGHPDAARERLEPALVGLERIAAFAYHDVWQAEVLPAAKELQAALRETRGR